MRGQRRLWSLYQSHLPQILVVSWTQFTSSRKPRLPSTWVGLGLYLAYCLLSPMSSWSPEQMALVLSPWGPLEAEPRGILGYRTLRHPLCFSGSCLELSIEEACAGVQGNRLLVVVPPGSNSCWLSGPGEYNGLTSFGQAYPKGGFPHGAQPREASRGHPCGRG